MISRDQISKKWDINKWVTGSKKLGIHQEHFWERDKLHLPEMGSLSLTQLAETHARRGLFAHFLKNEDTQEEPIVCLRNLPREYNHRDSINQFLHAKTLRQRLEVAWNASIDQLMKQPVLPGTT